MLMSSPFSAMEVEGASRRDSVIWRSERVCGVNCVYFLLRCHGCVSEYEQVLEELLGDGELPSITDLKVLLQSKGVQTLIGKTTPEGLATVALPAIVHLESDGVRGEQGGHFSVLLRHDKEGVTLLDGTSMVAGLETWGDFNRSWSGYLLYVDRDANSKVVWWLWVPSVMAGCFSAIAVNRYIVLARLRKTRTSIKQCPR